MFSSHVFWFGLFLTLAVGAKMNAKNQVQEARKLSPEQETMMSFAI